MRSNLVPAIITGFLLTVFAMTPTTGQLASGGQGAFVGQPAPCAVTKSCGGSLPRV